MDHYVDINVLPDPEFASHQVMSTLYTKLHRALVDLQAHHIGVSFPGYDAVRKTLGLRLRLHGSQTALQTLMAQPWMTGMQDHASTSPVQAVPAHARPCAVRRVQSKSSPQRLRRRQMRRHGIDEVEARLRIPDNAAQRLDLPYVQLDSASTEQRFRLFIRQQMVDAVNTSGHFNAYGLSEALTVPWF